MAYNYSTTVVTQLFSFEDFTFTMTVTGSVVAADVGKAVAIDTSAANAVKLVGDNDVVFGRLETFEDRTQAGIKVGAVARKFRAILPTSGSIAIGNEVVGSATAGVVKATGTQPAEALKANRVIEVLSGNRAVVEKI